LPIAWNPDPLPTIRSPYLLPVPRDPISIRFSVIIIWSIVTGWRIVDGWRIVPSVINRRRRHPYRRRSNKNPEMAMSPPGKG